MGFPFVTILFIIPQHAQAVYGLSPVRASLTVLPLLLTSPVATAASGVLTSMLNVPPSYLILVGSVIQVIGVGLATTIPLTGDGISAQQYGYEAIMGVGFGLTLSTVLTLGQLLVSKEDAGKKIPFSYFGLRVVKPDLGITNRGSDGSPHPDPRSRRNGCTCDLLCHHEQPS